MGNALLLHPYFSDLAVVSASSAVSGLAASNVQTADPSEKWRSASGSGSSLDFDFGASGLAATALALIGVNLSATATWFIGGSNTSNAHARSGAGFADLKRAIIDGEAAVLGESGLADFHALRGQLDGRSKRLGLYAFDLLLLDGRDLRERPLLDRKAKLQKLLHNAPRSLVYVEHMTGDSAKILAHACRMGIEGIVSKRAASLYRSGRSTH